MLPGLHALNKWCVYMCANRGCLSTIKILFLPNHATQWAQFTRVCRFETLSQPQQQLSPIKWPLNLRKVTFPKVHICASSLSLGCMLHSLFKIYGQRHFRSTCERTHAAPLPHTHNHKRIAMIRR